MKVSEFKLDEIGRLSKSSFEGGKDYLGLGYTKEKSYANFQVAAACYIL